MGARGPMRNPNSRRGQQEIRKRQKLAAIDAGKSAEPKAPLSPLPEIPPELPTCPKCLPRRVAEKWLNLVSDMAAAKIPLKQVDSRAIAVVARYEVDLEDLDAIAGDGSIEPERRLAAVKLRTQISKEYLPALKAISATPGERARALGIKPVPEKRGGKLAELLAARQARRG